MLLNPITVHNYQITESSSYYCTFEAILKVTFDLSSILWTTLIIFSVYVSVVRNYSLESKQVFYLLFAYLVPIIAAVIPAFFNIYGYDIYFCWFDSKNLNYQFWFQMGYYYIPLWVLFIINVILSQRTYRKLKKLGLQERQLTIFKRILLFPFILLATGIFGTISLLHDYFTCQFLEWLDFTGIAFFSLYGLFNSIAYGLNPIIREKIQNFIFKKQDIRSSMDPSISRTSYTSRNTQKLEIQLFQNSTRLR